MEKFLLFTTGAGSADPVNWASNEAVLYPVSELKCIKPGSARTLNLSFDEDVVTLKIKNGMHIKIMQAIGNAIASSTQSVITIADVDSGRFINKNIYGVVLA